MRNDLSNIAYISNFDKSDDDADICYVNPSNLAFQLRHAIEIIFMIIISPVIIFLFLVISCLVFFDFRGKIIFKQARAGKDGQLFMMYKFRTMKDMHSGINNYFIHQDERVTRLGSFLRKHRLDEFPQLLNVLKGEMSIIGPRPEIYELYKVFSALIPKYKIRKIIPQGITGWSQVNMAHTVTIEGNIKKLEFDKFYISNLSPRMDFMIIFKTIKYMFTGNFAR